MVVDTFALIAVLNMEPESARLAAAMEADPNRLISAATVVEAGVAIESRYGSAGGAELDLFIAKPACPSKRSRRNKLRSLVRPGVAMARSDHPLG